jgi:CspA family cold shock protein
MALNRKQQDELLFCERCGISFLWSSEEKKIALVAGTGNPPPVYCAGCRHLLPEAGRERGVIKWYNGRKHYGFITRRTGPEIYLHGSELTAGTRAAVGDLVEFQVDTNERGPLARAVRLLERAG